MERFAPWIPTVVCGVICVSRLGHNWLLQHSNMKAFGAWAVVTVVVGVATALATSSSVDSTRPRAR